MDLATRMRDLFLKALDLPADTDVANLRFREHPQWDSLGHMSLVVAIEDEFGVELDTDQLIAMNSFPKAVETVRSAGAGE
jgi:acyl carrier protein